MGKKLIINEKQLNGLANYLLENNHERIVKLVVNYLEANYEPTKGTFKRGGEYHEEPMIKNLVNDEMMTVKSLYEHVLYKFEGINAEFIKQVIDDWYNGRIDDNFKLSKNVRV